MGISVVTSMFMAESHILDFVKSTESVLKAMDLEFEFIIVDDGSPDRSSEIVLELISQGIPIHLVQLSRNFGHHKALMTGIEYASMDLVYVCDSDLEEPSELIKIFYDKMKKDSSLDVVYGVQQERSGSAFKKLSGSVFYFIFNHLAEPKIPKNLSVARLMTRRYVDCLISHKESEPMIGGLWQRTGFKQMAYGFKRVYKGSSTYNFKRQIKLMLDSIVSFSAKPLYAIFWLGLAVFALSMAYAAFNVIAYLFFDYGLPGYTSTISAVLLIGGLIILSLGVLSLYIGMIFIEVKRRPRVIIKNEVHYNKAAQNLKKVQ